MRLSNFLFLRLAGSLALAALVLLAAPAPAAAQYFGRNKVQFRTFDFQILQTEHFDVYFYPEEAEAVREGARMAERWYARLSRILDHQFEDRQPFIFYASHPHFQQTTTSTSSISEGTGGFTEVFKQRVVMPFTYSLEETDHVVGHELVHAFQYDISGLGRAGGGLEQAARRFQVPLWFVEGMAEYLSVGPVDPLTSMWVRDAALQGELPSIERMTYDPRIFPYRWGQALWAYVGGRWGDAAIGQILKLTGQGVPYPEAFQRILNIELDELSEDWHASIRRAYLPLLAERPEAREIAKPLITETREGGSVNLAPVLSPDGRFVAFLSELDFIDVELYLANAVTGEVIRRLQKGTVLDPHFASLRYINSAGTFSPDGNRFAFSALRNGRDMVVIVGVERGEREREIAVPEVDEINNPTWSPDGRSIVFTGLSGGFPDLYSLDVESGQTRRLTNDPYTELHPSFSPDGRSLAFSTERGPGTDLAQLTWGPYRLAVMDLATSEIRVLTSLEGQKNINPQWSRDGSALYFISNRGGIANVFRVGVDGTGLTQVTNLYTGVSGITDISPALSVARNADRLVFTAFEDGQYNIYSLTEARELAGTPVDATLAQGDTTRVNPALLPPIPRPQESAFNRVAQYVTDPQAGLPSQQVAAAWQVAPYRPRLGLDYVGQPQVGVATGGAFGGAGFYGGVAGIFSDVLGRHTLFGAVQAQGQIEEIGFALQYVNSRERWNYGVLAQRVPYVFGFYNLGRDTVEQIPVVTREIWRARYFDTSLRAFAQYPFSTVQRVEFTGGARRISTDYQIYQLLYEQQTGQFLGDDTDEREGFAYNLFEASAALVYDNALFGFTSPFAGQRYRFELAPTLGELNFVQATADYRRYQWFRPFTLAVRGLHNGRYGEEGEPVEGQEQRPFRDLYLGYPHYVRGYFDTYNSCSDAQGQGQDCEVLQQLFGSRVAVASAELRFPLIRQLVLGTSIGFPPIEGFLFSDAGVAWSAGAEPVFERFDPARHNQPGDDQDGVVGSRRRGILSSAGAGARINLFGYLIAEINYVNAFERERGWHWQFNFQPGW